MRVRELSRSDGPVEIDVAAPYSPEGVVRRVAGARPGRGRSRAGRCHGHRAARAHPTSSWRGSCRFATSGRPRSGGSWRRRCAAAATRSSISTRADGRRTRRACASCGAQSLVAHGARARARDRRRAAAGGAAARAHRRRGGRASSSGSSRRCARAGQTRIAACEGIEMLRAEVAAIEDGAAHRLSLVCDELREKMTVQFVRLVLEQSRSLAAGAPAQAARGRARALAEGRGDVRRHAPRLAGVARQAPSPPCARPTSASSCRRERGLFDPLFQHRGAREAAVSEPHRRAARRHRAHHRRASSTPRRRCSRRCC